MGELGPQGVGWYLRWGSSSCTQMLVTLQLLQLDSPPVAVVLCFGRTEGGRAGEEGRSGRSPRSLATRRLPSLLPLLFCIISCGAFGAKTVNSRPSEQRPAGKLLSRDAGGRREGILPRFHLGVHHPVTMSAADAMLRNGSPRELKRRLLQCHATLESGPGLAGLPWVSPPARGD